MSAAKRKRLTGRITLPVLFLAGLLGAAILFGTSPSGASAPAETRVWGSEQDPVPLIRGSADLASRSHRGNRQAYDKKASDCTLATKGGVGGTGTIWDAVRATQPVYRGTVVPRSFELVAGNSRVWVHGNATEHLAEYATSMLNRGVSSKLVNLASQQQIRSLQAAVQAATANGVPYGRLVTVGGWELKFAAPRTADQLPALIHALFR